MPPKDPELVSLRKELEDLIAKCQVTNYFHTNLYVIFICTHLLCFISLIFLENKCTLILNLGIS